MTGTKDKKKKSEIHEENNSHEEESTVVTGSDNEDSVSRIDELKDDTDLTVELEEANDRILRMAAEMENYRKRSLKEKEDAIKYSTTKFARDIVTVADDLERALDSIKDINLDSNETTKTLFEGIQLTMRSLTQILERNGIERFDPTGEKFDPALHEAMFEVPDTEKETGIIVHLVEPGYRISDRILRPARVGVSKSSK
tara:strand:+ start:3092 stop:3688 length:597 start_codon:yes stop_codon:yes gene_type:complete